MILVSPYINWLRHSQGVLQVTLKWQPASIYKTNHELLTQAIPITQCCNSPANNIVLTLISLILLKPGNFDGNDLSRALGVLARSMWPCVCQEYQSCHIHYLWYMAYWHQQSHTLHAYLSTISTKGQVVQLVRNKTVLWSNMYNVTAWKLNFFWTTVFYSCCSSIHLLKLYTLSDV